jgi:hypothetical protein
MDLIILAVTLSASIVLGLGGTHVILGGVFRILNARRVVTPVPVPAHIPSPATAARN